MTAIVNSPDRGDRLCDLDFTDIYMSEAGEVYMRGMTDVSEPLYMVPKNAVADLDDVHRRVCAMGQRENEFVLDHDNVRYRITKIQIEHGASYHIRRSMFPIPRLRPLWLPVEVVRALAPIGNPGLGGRPRGFGLILIAGTTGQGKTTTASSLLQEYLINYGEIAITIEDPPELMLEGKHGQFGVCYQVKVKDGDFAPLVRQALRQQPRYIMLGEVRDPSSAQEVLNAALSGHVVLATIHGGSIEEALLRMINYVASRVDLNMARDMLADGIAAVLHQEMRKIRASDGRVQRRLLVQSLFFGKERGLRQKVRTGDIGMLGTDIEAQRNRMAKGEMPIDRL